MTSLAMEEEQTSTAPPPAAPDLSNVRWAWTTRLLRNGSVRKPGGILMEALPPRPADVGLFRVDRIGHHRHVETETGRRIRLYEGDRIIGTFGNRYATDVYEGRVLELRKLHLLTASGMIGTVTARNRDVGKPTRLSFLGYVADAAGKRISTKQLREKPEGADGGENKTEEQPDVILIVGTGMSSGKTTVVRKLLRAFVTGGVKVAGCKLTGSASPRDLFEMRATGAASTSDFSDYGFPSTYGEPLSELLPVMDRMTKAAGRAGAAIVVMEIADGFLQPETRMLLESEEVRRRVRGVVVAGVCSSSLLYATEQLRAMGVDVWAVSGRITNAPLFVREFAELSSIPVGSSRGSGARLAKIVLERIGQGG